MTAVGVCTIVRGRHDHLANLLRGLRRQTRPAERVAVAVMGGPDPAHVLDVAAVAVTRVDVAGEGRLPLAAARNAARGALGDVDVVVLLDVDVIPSPTLVEDYAARVAARPAVWSGHVGYLPPGAVALPLDPQALARRARAHPARPRPSADGPLPRPELLWSLSVALPAAVYDDVGGFDESYVGYGAEDTDFALRADAAGHELRRTWAAEGWHQHHAVHDPPVQHLRDIVGNARTFHDRWGRWPMEGWLAAFADRGLIAWDPDGRDLALTTRGEAVARCG